jgi:hypothetical protein
MFREVRLDLGAEYLSACCKVIRPVYGIEGCMHFGLRWLSGSLRLKVIAPDRIGTDAITEPAWLW